MEKVEDCIAGAVLGLGQLAKHVSSELDNCVEMLALKCSNPSLLGPDSLLIHKCDSGLTRFGS